MEQDRETAVRERAHDIWMREGYPHGRHEEHWHRATQEIAAERGERVEDAVVPPMPPDLADGETGPRRATRQRAKPDRSGAARPRSRKTAERTETA